MPKVLARNPRWLSRPSPGFQLFRTNEPSQSYNVPDDDYEGPLRKVAHRGSEIFVATGGGSGSGNELRWAALASLKDAGENIGQHETVEQAHRVSSGQPSEQMAVMAVDVGGKANETSRSSRHLSRDP